MLTIDSIFIIIMVIFSIDVNWWKYGYHFSISVI